MTSRNTQSIWASVAISLLLSACIGDDTSGIPTESAEPSVLQFEESAAELGLKAHYDFDAELLDSLNEQADAGAQIGLRGGMAAGDFDSDGLTDLLILRGQRSGLLFRNQRTEFVDVTEEMDLVLPELASGAAFADVNGDDHSDLIVGGTGESGLHLFENQEGNSFEELVESGLASPWPVLGFALGDLDGDQDVDLLALRSGQVFGTDEERTGLLFRNDGDGRFEDESSVLPYPLSEARSEVARSAAFSDLDADGDSDLVLVQDLGGSRIYENQTSSEGGLKFTDITEPDVITDERGHGLAVGDYDNDGDMDWFVTGVSAQDAKGYRDLLGNRLYRNEGDGKFKDVSDSARISDGSWGFGACFADFNNDSLLDIFHVNGFGFNSAEIAENAREFLNDKARLFIQSVDSPGRFTELAEPAEIDDEGEGRGVICFDFDQDGDVDVLIHNVGGAVKLYENLLNPVQGSGANWLGVRLVGVAPNYAAVGAQISVTSQGITQTREVQLQSTFGAQQSLVAHFGLRNAFEVAELRIRWPDGAEDSVAEGLRTNQLLVIRRK